MPIVTITYLGVEGTGHNRTAAKRNAERKIQAALSDWDNPLLIVYRGHAALVYRQPSGWYWRTISGPDLGVCPGGVWGYGPCESLNAADSQARMSLAQLGWSPEDGEEIPDVLGNQNRQTQDEYRSWVDFQLRYRKASNRGFNDNDAHDYASRNPTRSELWVEDETHSAIPGGER